VIQKAGGDVVSTSLLYILLPVHAKLTRILDSRETRVATHHRPPPCPVPATR
jgi:hypothetical protein